MPLVQISVDSSRTPTEVKAISDGVYDALAEAVNVPAGDKFQIITTHSPEYLVFSKDYLGIERSDHFLAIQIFFNAGRTVEQKTKLYQAIADRLAANPGIRKEDILINLVEVPKENWSFGNGVAQYATVNQTPPPPQNTDPAASWMAPLALGLSIVSLVLVLWVIFRQS
ncbi:tautomerase family protein [Methylomagnum sp.]